jgi:TPP-dependent indolepyruvate ferredoxin oxidoreductase alpha subunit
MWKNPVWNLDIQPTLRLSTLLKLLALCPHQLDQKRGLNTAGFISGYRGSPLGGYDMELWKARRFLE